MVTRDEIQLMVQAARMYYENDLNQEEIAARMNLSRQKVSRLLVEARRQGIVKNIVIDPTAADPDLRERLISHFHLHDAVLASSERLEPEQMRAAIGLAASEHLRKVIQSDQNVGIGWGRTLFEAVNLLHKNGTQHVNVIPLIGGIGDISPFFQVNELARRLAEAFDGTYRHLYAPAFIEDPAVLESLRKTQEIVQMAGLWKKLDLAIVGIGHVEFQQISSMFFANHIEPKMLSMLEGAGTVGDICARFFSLNGAQVFPETGVIGIDLDTLKAVPEVIAIAGGMEKVRAILGAMRGGFIKTLVTDTATARACLAEDQGRR
jgi:DNA-binding transcriptional regulator LsrR (DeoR family)